MRRLAVSLVVLFAGFLFGNFLPNHAFANPVATTYFEFTLDMSGGTNLVGRPHHIDIDSSGNLYLTVHVGTTSNDHDIFKVYEGNGTINHCSLHQLNSGYQGIVHHDRYIYVASTTGEGGSVYRFSDQCPINKDGSYRIAAGNGPLELARDSSGNFWTSNSDNCGFIISKLSSSPSSFFGENAPTSCQSGVQGYWMNGGDPLNSGLAYTSTEIINKFGQKAKDALDFAAIYWIVFDAQDNLYVYDYNQSTPSNASSQIYTAIKKFTKSPSGNYETAEEPYRRVYASTRPSGGGIAVDEHRNIYFAEENCIKRISAVTGSVEMFAGPSVDCSGAPVMASLNNPSGLVFDTQRNALYVSNSDANNIIKISSICFDGDPCTVDTDDGSGNCTYPRIPPPINQCKEHNSICGEVNKQDAVACNDGNLCTLNDSCQIGVCTAGTGEPDCNDGNLCTDDSCAAATGCAHSNNTASCNDSNYCTAPDICSDGVCSGVAVICNDNDEATIDTCDPLNNGCIHTYREGACDDGSACTDGDHYVGGVCRGGAPKDCDDINPCTNDSCNPATGCAHENNAAVCDDNNKCTANDVCAGGVCAGQPNCDDNNACTDDACNIETGCTHNAVTVGACVTVPPSESEPEPTPTLPPDDDIKVDNIGTAGGKGGGCNCRMCVER